ncbi:alpha/beta hydrolase fold domain-containing protein [Nocardia sp. NPDC060256]|uniref:alpha/beta hydrolase fold domain-containing protein n=1 Tax=unclassified Nocardia TaxID=2637762 RepID=UPI003659B8AD
MLHRTIDPAQAWALAANGRAPLAPGTVLTAASLGGRPTQGIRPRTGGHAGTILHLHGGGYRTGSPMVSQGLASYLAAGTDMEVLLPTYRLSDEQPFPAAVADALAVYTALLDRGDGPERVAVLGDSSGAGLALAAVLAARDAGLPAPAAVIGLSPWYDLTITADSYERCHGTDTILSAASMRDSAEQYLAGADPRHPLASPLFASDEALAWLPPMLIHSSADEVLADDATRFTERIIAVGGRIQHRTWVGTDHFWHIAVPGLPAAVEAVDDVIEFLRARGQAESRG